MPDGPAVRLLEGAVPAAARDGPPALRLRRRGLLAGHRQPRPVQAGELRRARRARCASTSPGCACAATCGWGRASSSRDLESVEGPAFIGNYCRIDAAGAGRAVLRARPSVTLREHARTTRSVVDSSTYVGRSALVEGAIVGKSCDIRPHARLHEGVAVGDEMHDRRAERRHAGRPHLSVQGGRDGRAGRPQPDLGVARRPRASSGATASPASSTSTSRPRLRFALGIALGTALKRGAARRHEPRRHPGLPAAQARGGLGRQRRPASTSRTSTSCPPAVNRHFLKSEGSGRACTSARAPSTPR